jgi:hypothetical protein
MQKISWLAAKFTVSFARRSLLHGVSFEIALCMIQNAFRDVQNSRAVTMFCDQSTPDRLSLQPGIRCFPVSPHYVCHDKTFGRKNLHSSFKCRFYYDSLKNKTNYTFLFLYWQTEINCFCFYSLYITANQNQFPLFVSLKNTFRASCLPPIQ